MPPLLMIAATLRYAHVDYADTPPIFRFRRLLRAIIFLFIAGLLRCFDISFTLRHFAAER